MARYDQDVSHFGGKGMPGNLVIAYALYKLSASRDPSDGNDVSASRRALADEFPARETAAARKLPREMLIRKPAEGTRPVSETYTRRERQGRDDATVSERRSVPDPSAKVPGVTSCSTKYVNTSDQRTCDDSRKVQFTGATQAEPAGERVRVRSGGEHLPPPAGAFRTLSRA